MEKLDWQQIALVAFGVIGIIQYLKGYLPKAPGILWALLQPALCIGLGATYSLLPSWVSYGVTALALSQIGYETIIKMIKKKIEGETAPGGDA
jgi:hypothetical protein